MHSKTFEKDPNKGTRCPICNQNYILSKFAEECRKDHQSGKYDRIFGTNK
jgi:hypothetical protein